MPHYMENNQDIYHARTCLDKDEINPRFKTYMHPHLLSQLLVASHTTLCHRRSPAPPLRAMSCPSTVSPPASCSSSTVYEKRSGPRILDRRPHLRAWLPNEGLAVGLEALRRASEDSMAACSSATPTRWTMCLIRVTHAPGIVDRKCTVIVSVVSGAWLWHVSIEEYNPWWYKYIYHSVWSGMYCSECVRNPGGFGLTIYHSVRFFLETKCAYEANVWFLQTWTSAVENVKRCLI
jgi:hypothetical protein